MYLQPISSRVMMWGGLVAFAFGVKAAVIGPMFGVVLIPLGIAIAVRAHKLATCNEAEIREHGSAQAAIAETKKFRRESRP